jgi:hypothetical protein
MSAIRAGRVSLTPVTLDLSNRSFIAPLAQWSLAGWRQQRSEAVANEGATPGTGSSEDGAS